MTGAIEVYYWPTPNGHKVTIACEEMALPYVIKPVNIGRGEQFTPEFLAISPNNRMPAIVDPDGPDGRPISMFESGILRVFCSISAIRPMAPTATQTRSIASMACWTNGWPGASSSPANTASPT